MVARLGAAVLVGDRLDAGTVRVHGLERGAVVRAGRDRAVLELALVVRALFENDLAVLVVLAVRRQFDGAVRVEVGEKPRPASTSDPSRLVTRALAAFLRAHGVD